MGMLFYVRREKCGSNQEGRGREGIIVNLKYCIDAMIYSFEKKSYGAGHESEKYLIPVGDRNPKCGQQCV